MNRLKVIEVPQVPRLMGGYIFNTPEFQSLKPGKKNYFVLLEDEQLIARLCFIREKAKAFSGFQATFGSIDSKYTLNGDAVNYFVKEVIWLLRKRKTKEIIIKHWPTAYSTDINYHQFFLQLGFKMVFSEVNQHLLIKNNEFHDLIKKNELKKLKQCLGRGFTFKILTIDELAKVYRLVEETRSRKGYPTSMSFEELKRTMELMTNNYLLFGLYDKNKLIATSVSIKISHDILYNFYHADDFQYRSTSPMVMLIQKIYHYCQQKGMRILDLGISSENGLLNHGLYNFKKNLGCEISEKNTYRLSYD